MWNRKELSQRKIQGNHCILWILAKWYIDIPVYISFSHLPLLLHIVYFNDARYTSIWLKPLLVILYSTSQQSALRRWDSYRVDHASSCILPVSLRFLHYLRQSLKFYLGTVLLEILTAVVSLSSAGHAHKISRLVLELQPVESSTEQLARTNNSSHRSSSTWYMQLWDLDALDAFNWI